MGGKVKMVVDLRRVEWMRRGSMRLVRGEWEVDEE